LLDYQERYTLAGSAAYRSAISLAAAAATSVSKDKVIERRQMRMNLPAFTDELFPQDITSMSKEGKSWTLIPFKPRGKG
jgi:hypothetical protein